MFYAEFVAFVAGVNEVRSGVAFEGTYSSLKLTFEGFVCFILFSILPPRGDIVSTDRNDCLILVEICRILISRR